jgi:hypothetical protein
MNMLGYNLGLKKEDDHEKSPNIYKAVEMFKTVFLDIN